MAKAIIPGSIWRQVRLGTDAVYEALAVDDTRVLVAVHRAPGLDPGTHIQLTLPAVAAMEYLGADATSGREVTLGPTTGPAGVPSRFAAPRHARLGTRHTVGHRSG